MDQLFPGVVVRQRLPHLMEGGLPRQLTPVQGHCGSHALVVVIHDGREHRGLFQAAELLHLRQVLVGLGQAVEAGAVKALCLLRRLVLGDHFLPAAGVAGEGEAAQVRVRGQQPRLNQRRDNGDEPRGVAAGVGHISGPRDGLPLAGPQLREAVDPARRRPVGGGCVDHPGAGALRQGHGLHSRRVRQAQKHDVRFRHQPFPFARVLPLRLVDQQQADVVPRRQPVIDLQAGGAVLSVDVDLWFHIITPVKIRDKRYYRICLSFILLSVLFDLLNELFDLPDLPCGLRHRRAAVAAPQGHTVLQVQRVIHVRLEELGDSLQLLQRQFLQCLAPGRALGHQMAGDGVGVPEGHPLFREIICTVGGIDKAL